MLASKCCSGIVLLLGCVVSAAVSAEEVSVPFQGLALNANLERADGKSLADTTVLIVHGTQAHNKLELITYLQSLLKAKGYNSLAINLSLGINNRHGLYDCAQPSTHLHTDAVGEIGAWMKWLGDHGAKSVVLLGHSRGGNQVALYGTLHDEPLLRAIVMMAPMTSAPGDDAREYQRRFGRPLAPVLARAESLVKSGQGKVLLEHVPFLFICNDTSVTADSFVSYYATDARRDTPSLMPRLRKPALLLIAGNDEVQPDLDKRFAAAIATKKVQAKTIAGSDHFFRDLWADEAVDDIATFLK